MKYLLVSLTLSLAACTLDVDETHSALAVDPPREPSDASVVYRADAVIDAGALEVWDLLVDLDGYADWNPWVIWADGDVSPGGQAEVDVRMWGLITMRFQHVVLAVDPEERFCWRDDGWNAWFVYGQRCRWITDNGDGTVLLEQEILLDGALAGVSSWIMGAMLYDGMRAEIAALKETAEAP